MPSITWTDNAGNRIINGQGRYQIEQHGRVLRIENLVETDERSYTCIGVNKLGRAEGTLRINVTCTLDFQLRKYFSIQTDLSVCPLNPTPFLTYMRKCKPGVMINVISSWSRPLVNVSWTL